MYIESIVSAANSIQRNWNAKDFMNDRTQFTSGSTSVKTRLSGKIILFYENLTLDERRFLMKINSYEPLVEAYDTAKSTTGITRSDITILEQRLKHLSTFASAARQIGLPSSQSLTEVENPSIEVSFPIETKKSNVLNAIDTMKKFFNVLNRQKEILGKTESDLTLELLENQKIKVTFGTTLEYSLVIIEIWSALTSQSSKLKRINQNIESLRSEGISDSALDAVANEGTEIVNEALSNAKTSLTELDLNTGETWETAFNQLGRFLEACLVEGYSIKLIVPTSLMLSYQESDRGLLGERALNLAKYSRDRDDANITGSRKLIAAT